MNFRNALFVTLLLEAAVVALGVLNYGWTMEGLQAITRFSGRLSLIIFSLIFLLHEHPTQILKQVLSKKYFLVFAIAHGIHLTELLTFVTSSHVVLIPYRIGGGVLAYLLIFTMPFLQQLNENGKLSDQRFRQTALVCIYYVWLVFFLTYLPRVRGTVTAGGTYREYVILLGWVSLMLGFKVSQFMSRPTRRSSK